MGFLSDVFDPGKKDRDAAAALAGQGVINGGSFSGPGGISGGFDFQNGVGTSTFDLGGAFQNSLGQMQSLSQSSLNQAQNGLPPELQQLGDNTIGAIGANNNFNRMGNASNFEGLGQVFQSSLGTAKADPFELGSTISDKLRQLSERRNSRLVNKTFDRLKASGKLGTSGGAGIAGELDANLFDQGLKFDLAGLEAGRGMQQDAFGRVMGSMQGREAIGGRQFGEDLAQNQFGNNAALQQFGVGQGLFQQYLQNQAQGTNIGLAANASAMATSQLPLAFQQAAMAANSQASNSRFAAAGVNQNNAALATSPFLEALNAAGQFASNVGFGFGNNAGDSD